MKIQHLILSLIILCSVSNQAQAQVDVTVNPLGLIFGGANLGADVILSDQFSLGGTIGYKSKGGNILSDARYTSVPVQAIGKYYFNPRSGADRFYCSMFLRYVQRDFNYRDDSSFSDFSQSRFGLGFGLGTKIVSRKNVTFDFSFQLGRVISDNTTYHDSNGARESANIGGPIVGLRFGLGYRFGS